MASGRAIGATLAGVVVAAGAGVALALRNGPGTGSGPGADRDPAGWKSVTVLADEEDVRPGGRWPEPLAALQDRLEIRLRRASRDRGTEVHARFRRDVAADPGALRAALRDAKALVETGLVQRADPAPHGRRKPTPFGLAQDAVESRSKGMGLL
ncbi:MAG: hypothetical protein ACTHJL_13210 [Amnibacterium sp.]